MSNDKKIEKLCAKIHAMQAELWLLQDDDAKNQRIAKIGKCFKFHPQQSKYSFSTKYVHILGEQQNVGLHGEFFEVNEDGSAAIFDFHAAIDLPDDAEEIRLESYASERHAAASKFLFE